MSLSTKQSFLAGIGAALVAFFVIGFFVLLVMMLTGDGPRGTTAAQDPAFAAEANVPQDFPINFAPITDADWMRGNPDADITIIEYSDLECPYCKTFHPEISKAVSEYGDDVRWVYRHFPLSIHPKATTEAEAAECAGELGGNDGFWAFIERLFEITPANNGFNLDELPDVAEYIGLDRADFTSCLESGRNAEKVQQHINDAISAGGQGTPYSVIVTPDGEKIPVNGAVSYAQLKSFFDSVLN